MRSLEQVVRSGLAKLCILLGRDPNPALVPLWVEALTDLSPEVARVAFARLQEIFQPTAACSFPVPSLLEFILTVTGKAKEEEAERAWQYILELRRMYWNPDMLGGFSRGMPKLSDRLSQAARAAGVFRDFESLEALHVWAKKSFVESFLRYGELQQEQFLLPDGPLKDSITQLARAKALPE
jgi:hypothetical protein